MTAAQTLHLIEQFAAQAPFAVWVTDSRGVAIFANKALHDLFGIIERPSGAVGMNLFNDAAIETLGFGKLRDRAQRGELIDEIIEIPDGGGAGSSIAVGRVGKIVLRTVVYPLVSPTQKIEHFVVIMNDVTGAHHKRDKLRSQIREIESYRNSKEARERKLHDLRKEVADLEKEIRARGAEPIA